MKNDNQVNKNKHRILICVTVLIVCIGFIYVFCSKRTSEAGDIIDQEMKQILDNPRPLIYTPRPCGEARHIISQPQGTNQLVAPAHYSNRVLITSEDEVSHKTRLWICSIDGTDRTQIAPDDGALSMYGQWSYDDKYIIYVSYNLSNKTYSLNAFDEASKTTRKLVDSGAEIFSVSPVANELVYVPAARGLNPNRTVRIVSFNDSQSDTVLYEISGPNVVSWVSWKPDGKCVSVLQQHYEIKEGAILRSNFDLYLIDPVTKKSMRSDLLDNFFRGLGEKRAHGSLQWSPTGHILFSLQNTYIIEPDGQSWKKIMPDGARFAVWSSDYSKILFSTYQIDRMEDNIYWIPSNIGTSN